MEVIAERDDVDGFEFLSFEDIPKLECYLEEIYAERRRDYVKPFAPGYRHFQAKAKPSSSMAQSAKTKTTSKQRKKKASSSSNSSTTRNPMTTSGTNNGVGSRVKHLEAFTMSVNIDSVMEQQNKRVKKNDKRYVEDKLGGYLFVSGISLKDLDDHDDHMGPTWSVAAANKRKGSSDEVTPSMIKVPRNIYDDMVHNYPELGSTSQIGQPLKKYGLEQLKKLKRKLSTPGEQFSTHDGDYASSSNESENLDVCGIDEAMSRQFIEDSINKQGSCEGEKGRKNRCKMCCYNPCRIIEAKRISTIQGGLFPRYNVSFISTCNVHPPGDISIMPRLKLNVVDTCIQTTASDIKMHAKFAQRFPHKTIIVNASNARPEQIAKQLKPGRKSEHHRSSEQKRREQMHDSFIELRKVIYTTQALKDNMRASKQWILIEATKVINSLKNEATLLTAMKSNLQVKNKKLIEQWEQLSGKEFDPGLYQTVQPGQTKLINLYKEYRKDVQNKNTKNIKNEMSPSERLAEFCKRRLNQVEVLGKKIKQEKIEPIVVSDDEKKREKGNENQDVIEDKSASESTQDRNMAERKTNADSAVDISSPVTTSSKSPKQNKTSPLKNLKTILSKIQKEKFQSNPSESKANDTKSQQDNNNESKASSDIIEIDPVQSQTDKSLSDSSTKSVVTSTSCNSSFPNQPNAVPPQRMPYQTYRMVKSGNIVWPPVEKPHTNLDRKFTSCSLAPVSRNHQPFTNIVQSDMILNQPQLHTVDRAMCGPNMRQMQDKFTNRGFLSNKPYSLAGTKPTQWTTVGKLLTSREVTMNLSMPDIAAFVEVGENGDKNNEWILLENENSSPNLKQSLVSSISPPINNSLTLSKFGSIASNDTFNKTPISSTIDPMLGEEDTRQIAPEINEELLSQETIDTDLCIISNVYSLSEQGKCTDDTERTSMKHDANSTDSFVHDHDYCQIS